MSQQTVTQPPEIEIGKVKPHPDNPRRKLRRIDELAASIREHGILEPLLLKPNGDGFYIVAGERRWTAAKKAKLMTVPYRIATPEDERREAIQRMVHNEQRDDFSPTERARGIQGILDMGMTEEELARGLSVPVEHVQQHATIARSSTAVAVTEKYDLSFDQALAIAEFEGEDEIVKELTVLAVQNPGAFVHRAAAHREARAERQKIEAAEAEWREKGYAIVPEFGDGPERALSDLLAKPEAKTPIAPKAHESCPGRGVFVDTDFQGGVYVDHYCMDPAAYGHHDRLAPPTGQPKAGGAAADQPLTEAQQKEKEAKTLERRTHLACINASKTAEPIRRAFVKDLLKRRAAPKGTLAFVASFVLGWGPDVHGETFTELTGTKIGLGGWGKPSAAASFAKGMPEAALPLALLALIASEVEAEWEPNTWSSEHRLRTRRPYLEFLVACGYEPSTVERVQMGKAKAAKVLAEQDAAKAAARAAKKAAPAPTKKAVKRLPRQSAAAAKK